MTTLDPRGLEAATEAANVALDGYVRTEETPREFAEAVLKAYFETAPPCTLRWRPATKEDWESCAEFEIIWATPYSGCWAGPFRGMLHEDVPDREDTIAMVADLMELPLVPGEGE